MGRPHVTNHARAAGAPHSRSLGLRPRALGVALVAVQLGCLGVLAFTGPIGSENSILYAVESAGLFLGAWALISMRPSNMNITPDVRENAVMVTRGPYRWIRHPMYAALFLIAIAWIIDRPTALRIGVACVFTADMAVKITIEERHLLAHFPGYADYRRRTKRLLPHVW